MAARIVIIGEPAPDWTQLPQLNSNRAPTEVIFATDEWFAICSNINKVEPAIFDPNAFDSEGKVMDGWETRRKREAGHDWCIIKLGLAGVVRGFEVDTSFFTGNQVPRVSIQAASAPNIDMPPWYAKSRKGTKATPEELAAATAIGSDKWETLVPMSVLRPGYIDTCKHYFEVRDDRRWTHLRINYLPDGGIARIRCFGEVQRDWTRWLAENPETPAAKGFDGHWVDLVSVENGGLGLMASNSHYGVPQNLLGIGASVNMGDGWETARNPNRPPVFKTTADGMMELPGNEWCILQLGTPGTIQCIEIDTMHFKGNYPESCVLEAAFAPTATRTTFQPSAVQWQALLKRTRLTPHAAHKFDDTTGNLVKTSGPVTHVRLTIYPDGGIARVRLWGRPAPGGRSNM